MSSLVASSAERPPFPLSSWGNNVVKARAREQQFFDARTACNLHPPPTFNRYQHSYFHAVARHDLRTFLERCIQKLGKAGFSFLQLPRAHAFTSLDSHAVFYRYPSNAFAARSNAAVSAANCCRVRSLSPLSSASFTPGITTAA